MTRLLVLVEGQSEEILAKRTLTRHLEQHGVYVQPPILLWTKRLPSGGGFRGGVSRWDNIRRNLLPLTQDGNAWVTTLMDFTGSHWISRASRRLWGLAMHTRRSLHYRNGLRKRSTIRDLFLFWHSMNLRHGCSVPRPPSRHISGKRTLRKNYVMPCRRQGPSS